MEVIEEIKTICSLELLQYIEWKEDFPEQAKEAFNEFCLRYDQSTLQKSEIICQKWKLSETVALDIVKCVFARVWKYPKYDHAKSNANSIDNGIKRWLNGIVYTQLVNYTQKETCHTPNKETDLSLIYTLDDLVSKSNVTAMSPKEYRKKLSIIDDVVDRLSEKHRIVYLTYKLYAPIAGDYIPKSVSKKLQEELGLTAGSIRNYKRQANIQVKNYLNQLHGN